MLIDMRSKIIVRTMRAAASRPRWRAVGSALLVPTVAGAVVELDPERFGLSTTPVVLHALSFRGLLAVGPIAAGSASLLATSGSRARRPWRRAALGMVMLATGLAQGLILARRGWAKPPQSGRADLVVVSLNTLGGAATPRQVAALVAAELVDAAAAVVALPETGGELAEHTAAILAESGHEFQVFASPAGRPTGATSLLVHRNLGLYRQLPEPKMALGAVLAQPVEGSGPTLAAVHPSAPMSLAGLSRWRSEVHEAVLLARRHPVSVVAGDFNTTVDHRMMRDLRPAVDAATRAGRGAEGTWPAHFPAVLATPIDHVLVNGPFRVLGTRTMRVGGSDHRALIARLAFDRTG